MMLLLPILALGMPVVQNPLPVAVLESGQRVPCMDPSPSAGSLEFSTPYGVFRSFDNPVNRIWDAREEARLLERVRALDLAAWARRCGARGLVGPLLDAALDLPQDDPEGSHEVLNALEKAGAAFDPLPPETLRKDRLDLLWDGLRRESHGKRALLLGRLLLEIRGKSSSTGNGIGLADLRRGMRSKDSGLRRAATRIAERQIELDLRRPLLKLSLEDASALVRVGSAASLAALDPEEALGGWSLALWRSGSREQRGRAADHLARMGDLRAVDPLIYALATSSRAPGRYIFVGRQVSVVTDFDVHIAGSAAIADPKVSTLLEGSLLEIRIVATSLALRTMKALRKLTGENPGARPGDWLKWYARR
jgi:hypothetical protein